MLRTVELPGSTRAALVVVAAVSMLGALLLALLAGSERLVAAPVSEPRGLVGSGGVEQSSPNGVPGLLYGLELTKTVGTNSGLCAIENEIAVGAETTVYYCYRVVNTGNVPFTVHDLTDTEIGTILNDFPYNLAPGASAFITQSVVLTETTINTATWVAFDAQNEGFIEATAAATVTVVPPAITLKKTMKVGSGCGLATSLVLSGGEDVTYCFEVRNTGLTPLVTHFLTDTHIGAILTGFPFNLEPGASAFLTSTRVITEDVTNVATWTARTEGGIEVSAEATATANVQVASIAVEKVAAVSDTCAGSDALTLTESGNVFYCVRITNTGDVPFGHHEVNDPTLGISVVLTSTLNPGATLELSNDQIAALGPVLITESVTNTVFVTSTFVPVEQVPELVAAGAVIPSASASASAAVTLSVPLADDPEAEPKNLLYFLPLLQK